MHRQCRRTPTPITQTTTTRRRRSSRSTPHVPPTLTYTTPLAAAAAGEEEKQEKTKTSVLAGYHQTNPVIVSDGERRGHFLVNTLSRPLKCLKGSQLICKHLSLLYP